jgi:CheY-like chemotaxis protein
MPRGGQLQIQTSNVEIDSALGTSHGVLKPGAYVLLAVSDTGFGMDQATQSRIFEPFFTTKEAGRGTGLGLATCHGIVSQCGGQIVVYSELALGSVFKVYLPVGEGDVTASAMVSESVPLGRSETVLLVEDDPSLRSAIERMLAHRGYRVLVATDAENALELAEQHHGDLRLMLTDVVMPHTSGPDLAEQVRARAQKVKVLFMSGYTDHALLRSGVLAQQLNFIQKPFTLQTLTKKLTEILG